jgi:hypothetical protein
VAANKVTDVFISRNSIFQKTLSGAKLILAFRTEKIVDTAANKIK